MDNPVILATVDIQDTGHTRHMTYKVQADDKQNNKKQKNNTDNTENLKR